jgi:hypothetical protein
MFPYLRRRAILQSLFGLLATCIAVCAMLEGQFGVPWLSRIVAPLCFLPSVCLAGYLAQHLDLTNKPALFIGAPTIIAMTTMTVFAFFLFSDLGKSQFENRIIAVTALLSLGFGIAACYGLALRLALLRKRGIASVG